MQFYIRHRMSFQRNIAAEYDFFNGLLAVPAMIEWKSSCPKIRTEPESSNPRGVLKIRRDQPTWHGLCDRRSRADLSL